MNAQKALCVLHDFHVVKDELTLRSHETAEKLIRILEPLGVDYTIITQDGRNIIFITVKFKSMHVYYSIVNDDINYETGGNDGKHGGAKTDRLGSRKS